MIMEYFKSIKCVFKEKKGFYLFVAVSLLMFALQSILTLATTTDHSIGIFIMMNGLNYAIESFLMIVIISLLFGLCISLTWYRLKLARISSLKKGSTGYFGMITGIFASGCPMCGSFILGLFGMPLGLFFLPFKGIELKLISIVLLSISVILLSKDLIICRPVKTR